MTLPGVPLVSNRFMDNFVLTRTYNVNNSEITRSINADMFQRGEYKDHQ